MMAAWISFSSVRSVLTIMFLAGNFVDSRTILADLLHQSLETGVHVNGQVEAVYTSENADGSLVRRREHYDVELHIRNAVQDPDTRISEPTGENPRHQEDEPRLTFKEVAREMYPHFRKWVLGEVKVNENVVQELYRQPCGEFLFCDQRFQFCDYSTNICEPCSAICPDRPGSSWCSELCPVVHGQMKKRTYKLTRKDSRENRTLKHRTLIGRTTNRRN